MFTVYRYKNQYNLPRYLVIETGLQPIQKVEAAIFEGEPEDCRRLARTLNSCVSAEGVQMVGAVQINQIIYN